MPKQRITDITRYLMLGSALFVDILQFILSPLAAIPAVGQILDVILLDGISLLAGIFFYIWFKIHHVGFLERGAGRLGAYAVVYLAELLIPFFPGIFVMVWITIRSVRKEDALIASGKLSREDLDELNKILEKGFSLGAIREFIKYKAQKEARSRVEELRLHQQARIDRVRKTRNKVRQGAKLADKTVNVMRDIRTNS